MVTHQFRLELSRAYIEQVIRKMRLMMGSWDEGRMTHPVLACSAGWVSGILDNHKHPPKPVLALPVAGGGSLEFLTSSHFLLAPGDAGGRSSWIRK